MPTCAPGYEVDWTGRYRGEAIASSARTVSGGAPWSAACPPAAWAIVPQGGNTRPRLRRQRSPSRPPWCCRPRLHPLDAVDVPAAQVTAGAGVTIQRATPWPRRGPGLRCRLGGTGERDRRWCGRHQAGGLRVVRFGTMRTQLTGVQAVLADGTIVDDLRGLPKETVGPTCRACCVAARARSR